MRRVTVSRQARHRAWEVARTAVTVVVLAAAALLVFSALPPRNPAADAPAAAALGIVFDIVTFGALITFVTWWQVRRIRASHRAPSAVIEAIALVFTLFIGVMARMYHVLSVWLPDSFNRPLSFGDAAYFSVTVFTTVGFGDIYPTIMLTKALTAFQMIVDIVLLGVVVRILVSAADEAQRVRAKEGRARTRVSGDRGGAPSASRRIRHRARGRGTAAGGRR